MASMEHHHHVWVGNLPYTTTEEEIREIMSKVAPVVNVRIRYDKETGQSKGFAFCEYNDAESCMRAVKHLHGTLVGGRPIRLDFFSGEQSRNYSVDTQRGNNEPVPALDGGSSSAWPSGRPPRLNSPERMRRLEFPSSQHLHRQKLILASPDRARSILRENPSFCYALLHAQFICGMLDEPFFPPDEPPSSTGVPVAESDRRSSPRHLLEAKRLYEQSSEDLSKRAQQQLYDHHPYPIPPWGGPFSSPPFQRPVHPPTILRPAPPLLRPPQLRPHHFIPPRQFHPIVEMQIEQQPPGPPLYEAGGGNQHPPYSASNGMERPMHSLSFGLPPPTGLIMQQQGGVVSKPEEQPAHSFNLPVASTNDAQSLVDQILSHPDVLQQILSVTPGQEALWSPQEREEMTGIRVALRQRGFQI